MTAAFRPSADRLPASACRVPTPTTGRPSAKPRPLANDSPTRSPVNDPGPTVTPMRLSAGKARPASAISSSTRSASRSWCPRGMGSERAARTCSPSRMATEQASSEVSRARRIPPGSERLLAPRRFRDVVAKHVFHARLQGRGRGGATGAGAAHMQPDDAGVGLEAVEQDIAAVLGHGRADAGIQQVLDLGHYLGGFALIDLAAVALGGLAFEKRLAGGEVLHHRRQYRGLQLGPAPSPPR